MKKIICCACLLLCCAACQTAAAPDTVSQAVWPIDIMAALPLEITPQQAKALMEQNHIPKYKGEFSNEGPKNTRTYLGLSYDAEGHLESVGVESDRYATSRGVRIGQSREEIAAVYDILDADIAPVAVEGDCWLLFRFDNKGILTTWSYGRAGWIPGLELP